jgi:hypothetical protein
LQAVLNAALEAAQASLQGWWQQQQRRLRLQMVMLLLHLCLPAEGLVPAIAWQYGVISAMAMAHEACIWHVVWPVLLVL